MTVARDPEQIVMQWARGAPKRDVRGMIRRLYQVLEERNNQDREGKAKRALAALGPGDYVGVPYHYQDMRDKENPGPKLRLVSVVGVVVRVNKKTVTIKKLHYYPLCGRKTKYIPPEDLVAVRLLHPITREQHERDQEDDPYRRREFTLEEGGVEF